VTSELAQLAPADRVEELARMLGGAEITAKTRAHAREMLESGGRPIAPVRKPGRRAAES
jgi:DNA repair ATPase RecN